jgi:hypothetical protein
MQQTLILGRCRQENAESLRKSLTDFFSNYNCFYECNCKIAVQKSTDFAWLSDRLSEITLHCDPQFPTEIKGMMGMFLLGFRYAKEGN